MSLCCWCDESGLAGTTAGLFASISRLAPIIAFFPTMMISADFLSCTLAKFLWL